MEKRLVCFLLCETPAQPPPLPLEQNLASAPADSISISSSNHLDGAAGGEGGEGGKGGGGGRQQQNLNQEGDNLASESTAALRGDPAAELKNAEQLRGDRAVESENAAELEGDMEVEKEVEVDIPDELEDIVEALLCGLRDRDTVVRWSSAKGIGRITERLTQDLGKCACVRVCAGSCRERRGSLLKAVLPFFRRGASGACSNGARNRRVRLKQ